MNDLAMMAVRDPEKLAHVNAQRKDI